MRFIGIMTGNSLDAVDVVLTEFANGKITDIAAHTQAYPQTLTDKMLQLRQLVRRHGSDMSQLALNKIFIAGINRYTTFVAQAVNRFLQQNKIVPSSVTAIGFHGQTLDHFPPSLACGQTPYTLQVGNAQLLADKTRIPVIFDFRSDDIFNHGEGAPLAPMHNAHLARSLKADSVAFYNAGNTGNLTIIAGGKTYGWDVGPFNHFADMICRNYWHENCDLDAKYGQKGKVKAEIVRLFYEQSAIDAEGHNFFELLPPKSSDPSWYRLPQGLDNFKPEDVLCSVEYFSAYNSVLSLRYVPQEIPMPEIFLLFGGGWHNPLSRQNFQNILQKQELPLVLPEHKDIFAQVFKRFKRVPEVSLSDAYGISGQYMEARIFADLARCHIEKIPFCYPEITGCTRPSVCGIMTRPDEHYAQLWSRAAKGWDKFEKNN